MIGFSSLYIEISQKIKTLIDKNDAHIYTKMVHIILHIGQMIKKHKNIN